MAFATIIYRAVNSIIVKYRRIIVICFFLLQATAANYLAYMLRLEFIITAAYFKQYIAYLPLLLIIRLFFYLRSGLYKDLWRYSSVDALVKIIKSSTLGTVVFLVTVRYLMGDTAYPRSIYIIDWLLLIMMSGGERLLIRVFREYLQSDPSGKKILLIGAGNAGEMIVRDMKNNPRYPYNPIGFIDDDPRKKGFSIHGIPILGPTAMINEIIEKHRPEEILISMPSAGYKAIKEIYEVCKPFKLPIKTLPAMHDIIQGNVSVSQIKPLSLEDLLQREPVRTDIKSVKDYIEGKSVLVTGAGGSIGSELCRQIIEYKPSKLILFDRYENGLFQIDLELKMKRLATETATLVGDILDAPGLEYLFLMHKPQLIFHAAAHKHVPLMEHNQLEAVKNNIFGTKNILDVAARHKAESFVMVSTDKAVNPVNIMGATKRVAEFLTVVMNSASSMKCSTVRFGNVLGSNGSVINIFKEQLERGGPLTVTHPEIKRFFMLIPEAVQLVLIPASIGEGGEIFVLEMGEQIKITDLAENIIRLSGFIPYEDIKIEFTGLRPGEKLYEELFDKSEVVMPTMHEKLRIAVPREVPTQADLSRHISELEQIVMNNAIDEIVPAIRKIIPGFRNQEQA